MWLELDQLKGYLDKKSDVDDGRLLDFIASAEARIKRSIGHVERRTVRETVSATWRQRRVILTEGPFLGLTSVTQLDSQGNAIGPITVPWSPGPAGVYDLPVTGTFLVIYEVGLDPIPGDVVEAGYELAMHYFRTSQLYGGSGRAKVGDNEQLMPGAHTALPYRVKQLLGLDGDLDTNMALIG